jgi:site-specific recombinase XerD
VLLSAAFEKYRQDVILFRNQSPKTEEAFKSARNSFVKFMGDIEVENITFDLVREWKVFTEKHTGQATTRGYIISLRQVLRYCTHTGVKCMNYETLPISKRPETVPDYLTEKQVAELYNHIKPKKGMCCTYVYRNRAIVSILYSTGLRVSELVALNRDDIKTDSITIVGKGGKAGLVFLDHRAIDALNKYLGTCRTDHSPALFLGACGRRMTTGDVRSMFRRMSLPSDPTKRLHPHILRHSFATGLLKNDCNPYTLMKMMRHADFNTTKRYLHIADPELKEAFNRYHKT